MSKKFDYLVFIGRFQPLHLGHTRVIDAALELADRVIVLCGSATSPRSLRNPWTLNERIGMIEATYPEEFDANRLIVDGIPDLKYRDHLWVGTVQKAVHDIVVQHIHVDKQRGNWTPDGVADKKIGLIGCKKDNTSYYLDLFPMWDSVPVLFLDPLNATDLRNALFAPYVDDMAPMIDEIYDLDKVFPKEVGKHFQSNIPVSAQFGFMPDEAWEQLGNEWKFIVDYRKSWEVAPYPPTFVATDALVTQSSHILLIERRAEPGKGLWAMPGGFLDQHETIAEGTLRELVEETKIKVPTPVLERSVRKRQVFDDPHRSMRGRMITHVTHYDLKPGKLPKVKGGDDAAKAKWVPLSEVKEDRMFSDHYHIIKAMLGDET